MVHYYIETDGEVFLVEEGGRLRFPISPEEISFPIEVLHTMHLGGERVHFCAPTLAHHPSWYHKDELVGWDRVDPLVRRAVNTSLPRVVAEAVIVERAAVLMVKASRGFNRGRWTLPGGFVSYGESPAQAVAREVREEVGVACEVGELLGLESFIGHDSCLHWHMCFYEAALRSHAFAPPPDEIEQVHWFPLEEALERWIGFRRIRETLRRRYLEGG